ncbi:MAG: TonB-dependent receptor [Sphingopyxis sp.]|nr:TonB-dependent receptor [Sphingopyxis sp.]
MKTSFISLIALAAATTPAYAQSNPDLTTTDETGDTIVVTASRSGEGVRIDQLGSSVTVIDATAMEKRQTRILSDVLRDVPGVAVSRLGAIGGQTQLRIRGTEGNHVLTLIDGIEVSDPFNGEYDFGTLIASPNARIEVLRGQQSSLYGSDAIGGVIHYITLTGAEAPGISARAEAGSFETFSGDLRVAGVSGNLDYAISGAYLHTGGTPTARFGTRDIGSDNVGVSGKLIWSPSDSFKLTGVVRYGYTDADSNNSEFDGTSPLYGYIVDSPDTYYTSQSFHGLLRAEFIALDGRWTNALTGQVTDTVRKAYSASIRDGGSEGRRYKGSFESSLRFGTDAIVHRLTAAVDVEREEFRNTTPSPFVFQGQRDTDNIGFVGEYELLAGDSFALGASVRHDENDRFDDATTYRIQSSYKLPTGTRIRGAYGTGVKNPGYYELYGFSDGVFIGNPDLRPEKSKGWEAGIEQTIGDDLATVGVTYFDSKLKGEIFTTFPPPNFVATPANRTTTSKQRGVEVFAQARPIPQIELDLAYTWLKARENGVLEVRRPKHVASFNATIFSPDERFSSTLTVRYNGRQTDVAFLDPIFFAPTTVSLKEYVLVNLNANYKLTDGISVFARVENLAGEKYEEVFSYRSQGRAAYGGVRVRF